MKSKLLYSIIKKKINDIFKDSDYGFILKALKYLF